ncbi:MAG: substrate-binding domain-containing protein, partial [Clostridium butyricum]
EDISIAGFDDIPSGKIIRPALTTIRQDIKMRASKAILLLKELIDGNVKENNLILPVELIERDSVAYLSESR